MIRILTALSAFVLLTGAQCSRADIEHYSNLVTGTPQAVMSLTDEPPMVETVAYVEAEVVEPEPDCTPTLWRGIWTNPCTGETWEVQ